MELGPLFLPTKVTLFISLVSFSAHCPIVPKFNKLARTDPSDVSKNVYHRSTNTFFFVVVNPYFMSIIGKYRLYTSK